jgi:uncharacterized SAM-binding protein YcdF (DUF218 family)
MHLVLVSAIVFLLLTLLVAFNGLNDDIGHSDAGVVLGNEVHGDGTPSDRLAARLDTAADLYRRGLLKHIVVSGGRGRNGVDEATAMKAYLVRQGIPSETILTDSLGLTTADTAKNTVALARQKGWSTVTVISQYFHIPRCRLAFSRAGMKQVHSAHAPYFELRDLYSTPREVIGYAAYMAGLRD